MADQRHERNRQRTGAWIAAAVAGTMIVLPPATAGAQMLCSKPLAPLCSTTDMKDVADATGLERCASDTQKYLNELGDYRQCLQTALKKAEANAKAAEDFKKCLDAGRKDCKLEGDDGL